MLSFEEFMKANEKYIHISFDIKEIAEAFRADEKLVRLCFRNGHYSRGILAAALCKRLNGRGYSYSVRYESGEDIFLIREPGDEKLPFHVRKPSDETGNYILANTREFETQDKPRVYFNVPMSFYC